MATAHTTLVLLYSSAAGMCRKNVLPTWSAVTSRKSSSDNKLPLIIQATTPIVTLQLKVAVDPSVALTDVGAETNAAVFHDNKYMYFSVHQVYFGIINACITLALKFKVSDLLRMH